LFHRRWCERISQQYRRKYTKSRRLLASAWQGPGTTLQQVRSSVGQPFIAIDSLTDQSSAIVARVNASMLSSNLSSDRPARSTRHLRSPSQPHHAASPFPVNLGHGAGRVAIRSRSGARARVAESPRESAYGRCLSSRSETVEPGGICNVTIACSICEYARSVRLSIALGSQDLDLRLQKNGTDY
jgi:hypothetical protein